MQRVVILGCSGTGKSTLARQIGVKLGLPVVHLDSLFWEPGWVEAQTPVFRERVMAALAADRWVCDGNYITKTADLKFPRANLILWIDQPVWLRIWRILRRTLGHLGQDRSDLAAGCPDRFDPAFLAFLKWTWEFDQVTRPRIQAALDTRYPDMTVTHLSGDNQISDFLSRLDKASITASP